MKRAHRRAHLLAWIILVPVTFGMFVLSLYLKQPEPTNSDSALESLRLEAE